MLFEQKTFQGERHTVDGNQYKACEFRDCAIIFNGGEILMHSCHFANCTFELGESARRTIAFLNYVYNIHPGGATYVEGLLKEHVLRK